MTRFALEINDAGLLLARGAEAAREIVGEQPGIALVDAGIVTGTQAAERMRLKPLGVQNDFWRLLGTEPLPRLQGERSLSAADLAHAQLASLLEPVKAEASGLLLAVPPGYSRTQLGLLLGIAEETGIPLVGLADSALVAAALEPASPRILQLDLQLHQAVLSVLETDGTGLKRSRFEILPRQGWVAAQQAWIRLIADSFIRRTRFDPLHQAATEQLLVDRLSGWLAVLATEPAVTAEIPFADKLHSIELTRDELTAAVQPMYGELLRLIQAVRPAGMPMELQLTHRANALPGLADHFTVLRDSSIRVLPKGAAAFGALLHEAAIARPPENRVLVYRLPVVAQVSGAESAPSALQATLPQSRPTHVLFGDRAWAIGTQPLTLGWSVAAGRALLLPQSVPGLSRSHCTVTRRNGSVVLADHSTYGSFVNNERVNGETLLSVGDKLRLGSPGVTLELIQLVQDDGTPQD